METVSHRELRNNSGRVLEEVRNGAVIAVTNHGEITAVLVPPDTSALDRLAAAGRVRVATDRSALGLRRRVRSELATSVVLDELRDER